MRIKRLLAVLLTFCLVFGTLSPMAFAVKAGDDGVANADWNQNPAATEVASAETGSGLETVSKPATLKDALSVHAEEEQSAQLGTWNVTPVQGQSGELLVSEVPQHIEELKKAAEFFDKNETVAAFVVMEDQPLADTVSSISLVTAAMERPLIEKQNSTIAAIERNVLGGNKLDVRYQFTYLTNSFSIRTEFANLEKIAQLEGVKSVFVMPVYHPATTTDGTMMPSATASGEMTGVHSVWESLGFTGQGMTIAVIDTGLDLDHQSFAADPQLTADSMTVADIAAVLTELNAYDKLAGLTAEDLYRTAKVPFAFNYVDRNLVADHSRDNQGDHGTHVAGIAAANANVEGTDVVGMAPDAQILVMKVFGAAGGAYMDDIVAAVEDSMILNVDAANLSLGSTAGFSTSDTEMDLIYERIASQDTVVLFAAGNDGSSAYGNMWGTDLNHTDNVDTATINQPATFANAFAVGSANNTYGMYTYFTVGETRIPYTESTGLNVTFNILSEMGELEYVMIPGLGYAEDYEGLDVLGKVAVVSRGELNFSQKLAYAEANGAVGLVVYNNVDDGTLIGMDMTDPTTGGLPEGVSGDVPAVAIGLPDGLFMAEQEDKGMVVAAEQGMVPLSIGGQMSAFTCWGPSPDLRLLPDITGIGGNVFSTIDAGKYGVMSGTSMATPQVAGVTVLIRQYLNEQFPNVPDGAIRDLTEALLMSTAEPVVSSVSHVEATPRIQGAGLVNAKAAVESGAYLTVGGGRPKAELGDNPNGKFTFSFEIHNFSETDKTYTLDSSLLTEDVVVYGPGLYFMAEEDRALSGSVSFDKSEVTVPAGGKTNITVSISLSAEDKAFFAEYYANGGYVEGFVYLNSEDEGGVDLSLPFLGFYGDWTQPPVFDSAFWYENSFFGLPTANGLPDGHEYYTAIWVSLGGTDWVLGVNPYTGAVPGPDGKVIYDPANNSLSPNGDGVLDGIEDIYVSLMRNAKTLTFTYTNTETGEVLRRETYLNNSKTMFLSGYGAVIPWLYAWYGDSMYKFTDADGKTLPNDTKLLLTIEGTVDYGDGGDHVLEIPITIDTVGPQVISATEKTGENGEHLLVVEAKDNVNLAYAALMNATGTRYLDTASEFTTNENGNLEMVFNVTDLGTEFQIVLCDFAANENFYKLTYTSAGENLPEMDTSKLYAYRIYDGAIMSDEMFGWIALDKFAAEDGYVWVETLTSDYMEYYALTAAEYAGGKIFAVDAGYNFLVMEPGLWNRQLICNLGKNILSLAFDDTTDTMYALAKDTYYSYLYSVDLLTGEMTQLKNFGVASRGPYFITVADDGTIYAMKQSYGDLYTLDKDNSYTLTQVYNAAGEKVSFKTSSGSNATPNYAQSMTWSDGKLYWAYFRGGSMGNSAEMIVIDTENDYSYVNIPFANVAYDSTGRPVAYQSDNELVGMLTLDETDYTIPESTTAQSIWLNTTEEILRLGQSLELSVNPVPWNVELEDVQWTSSDETVATVVDGKVTTVGGGKVTITAACGELTATCELTVVDISGTFYAYDYYNTSGAYGDMVAVETSDLSTKTIGIAPVDFIAGDYNGHDGFFYGYTEDGQFYRYDIETGMYEPIGAKQNMYPQDMAYDYTTGTMWALGYQGSGLYAVNLQTGELIFQGSGYGPIWWTLACDAEGQLWSVSTSGELGKLAIGETMDPYTGQMTTGLTFEIVMSGLGYLSYVQSMCYDYANDVLIWACPEYQNVAWIDHNAAEPFILSLGTPYPGASFEWMGMFTIPETIPELANVAAEEVSLSPSSKLMVQGAEFMPSLSVKPANANSFTMTWSSTNTAVATIKPSGMIKAVAPGETTISCVVNDNVSGNSWEVSFPLVVIEAADDVYGYVIDYGAWVQIPVAEPANVTPILYAPYNIYAQEYYNGKIYAIGYDATEWQADMWQLLVLDAKTFALESATRMPAGYPYVYDMTYDYTTSTMFAVAGVNESISDLYMMNMETGELTLIMETEEMLMRIAASPEGKLYAGVNNSRSLYQIDPVESTMELVNANSASVSGVGSMTYDYDTGYLYTPHSVIHPETGVNYSLGVSAGTVTGLVIISENFPEESENPELKAIYISDEKLTVAAGGSQTLTAATLPMSLSGGVTWSSSDESVAKVENGVVTGVKQGKATITATATDGTTTLTAECVVTVLNEGASFLTYNVTDGGWAQISRADSTVVTNLTEGVEEAAPTAIVSIGADVYGVDQENNLFRLNTETFERTVIADAETLMTNVALYPDQGMTHFAVRDLAYDPANDRVLALGTRYGFDSYGTMQEFYNGSAIYELDLETGVLTHVYTFAQHNFIQAMTVGTDGVIYFFNSYDQFYSALDLVNGTITDIIAGSTQSMYGDDDGLHDLYYDDLTGLIFHLFTSNSTFYRMLTVNPETSELVNVGYVGEVIYANRKYTGDAFSGLTFIMEEEGSDMPEVPVDPVYTAVWKTISTTLGGNIGLNFYVELSVDAINDAETYVQFTYADKVVKVPMAEAIAAPEQGKNVYRFTCNLTAKNMADEVTAQVFSSVGAVGAAKTMDVATYCNWVISNYTDDKTVGLMKAMLNYGASAQVLFNHNVDNLANAALSAEDKVLADVDASAYKHTITGSEEGIKINSMTLLLDTNTDIRFYFELTGEKTIDEYTFAIDGKEVTPVEKNGMYYVELSGISAHKLGQMHTVTVGGLTVEYAALSYVNQVMNYAAADEATVNMAKALYAYAMAAEAYAG